MGDSHPWHVTSQIDLGRRHTAAAILLEAPLREDPKSKERDRWTASRLTSISMRRRFFASGLICVVPQAKYPPACRDRAEKGKIEPMARLGGT
jgi:hypothetical protein